MNPACFSGDGEFAMIKAMKTIEVDEHTAEALEARAAARGVSVGQVVAELVAFVDAQMAADAEEIAELNQRWAAVEAGEATVPHEEVARWLETWGTPAFKHGMRSQVSMLAKVIRLEKLGGFRLRVRFNDGREGVHDFTAMVNEPGPMLEPLRDEGY